MIPLRTEVFVTDHPTAEIPEVGNDLSNAAFTRVTTRRDREREGETESLFRVQSICHHMSQSVITEYNLSVHHF